jgi:hypothetical protein
MIVLRMKIWVKYAAQVEEMRNSYKILVGKSQMKNFFSAKDVEGKILIKRIIEE